MTDERDETILRLLQADAWLTYAEISRRVSLSASAVQRRVERLVSNGVLLGARARVATESRGIVLFVMVDLVNDAATTIRRFTSHMKCEPIIEECLYVAGENDVLLKIVVPDIETYANFIERRLNASSLVRRFSTLTKLRTLI